MNEREKIIDVLNKNFTQEVECTLVYTTTDGKEVALPQELCDIFNDIVTQAVIPYFADALIAAGIGDTTNLIVENEVLQRDVDNLVRTLEEGTEELQEVQHRAEVAERALDTVYKEACEKYEKEIKQLMRNVFGDYIANGIGGYIDNIKERLLEEGYEH